MQDFTVFIANHMGLFYTFAILLIALMGIEFLRSKRNTFRVGPKEAVQLINKHHAVIVDVRAKDAFDKGHILNAVSMTAAELTNSGKKLAKFKGKPIILVCNTGMETQKLATTLKNNGHAAFSLAGGINAWADAELPIVRK